MPLQSKPSIVVTSVRVWLVALPLAIGGLVLAPYYLVTAILPWPPSSFDKLSAWYSTLFLYRLVSNLLFTYLIGYLAFSLFGIGLVIAALLWARPRWLVRLLLVLTLLALVAVPWIYRYRPALVAAPGLAMREPTDPGWLGGVVKQAQAGAEITPCRYELLGWFFSSLLYRSTCGNDPALTLSFDPKQWGNEPLVAQYIPGTLTRDQAPSHELLEKVRAPGVWPATEELNARRVSLPPGSLRSPDGQWVALVARHLYGPEDVVIVQWSHQD